MKKRAKKTELGRMLQQQIDAPGIAHPSERAVWKIEPAGASQSILGLNRWPAELRQLNKPAPPPEPPGDGQ